MTLREEYRRSLKMPEAEEIFDLIFYRPAAFLFVKGIYPTEITPNQITTLSLIAALLAAWQFGTIHLATGAALYALANILDCADGQLARLKKNGTLLGRVFDGAFDYLASIAIFIGIGISAAGMNQWWLVGLTGLSSGMHALFFDHYQNEFISIVRSERNFLEREMETFSQEIASSKRGIRRSMLQLYLRYLGIQRKANTGEENPVFDPPVYRRKNSPMIRCWSFLGPTTNRTILIISALFGHIEYYLWTITAAGNLWLVFCFSLQRQIHKQLAVSTPRDHPTRRIVDA